MNEAILQWVHRAIQHDRAALRSLLERYQGVTYGLAFRKTGNFPQAQRVAAAAWPLLARRLPKLTEPERFPDLLAEAIDEAWKTASGPPPEPEERAEGGHSILKTEKVQARRALRQALAACPLAEAVIFFLRHVEGLSVDEIAELYGVEPESVKQSLRAVSVDLAFRAGFAGAHREPPDPAALSPERAAALGFSVIQTEGGGSNQEHARAARTVQTDPDARREDEAVRTVLDLSTRTFSAHRLPDEFVKDVLMAIPYVNPPRRVELPRSGTSVYQAPSARLPSAAPAFDHGATLMLALAGAVAGMAGLVFLAHLVSNSAFGTWLVAPLYQNAAAVALALCILSSGGLALYLACPPILGREPTTLPPVYSFCYGVVGGSTLSILFGALVSPSLLVNQDVILGVILPLWFLAVLSLLAYRARMAIVDLERRVEARLRRMEDATPQYRGYPDQGAAAETQTPVGAVGASTVPTPSPPPGAPGLVGDPPRLPPAG